MNQYKFAPWLSRWKLIPDGSSFVTHTSQLLSVKTSINGIKAMLKITEDLEEQRGNAFMAWWGGSGAVQVISHENEAILVGCATGPALLSTMSRKGQDTEACRILCLTANRLHICQKANTTTYFS